MADIKIFSLQNEVTELSSTYATFEKELQNIIEKNMTAFFNVTFLKSEFIIANGRIDSIGIDENYCPVIFEYKRNTNENIITQGVFYRNQLLKHKADYKLLVMEVLGIETANKINWNSPCVICIANDFNIYDDPEAEMQRNIRLVKYKMFENDLLLFEYLNEPKIKSVAPDKKQAPDDISNRARLIGHASQEIQNLYELLEKYILSLGNDVKVKYAKTAITFRRKKVFVFTRVHKLSIGFWAFTNGSISIKNIEDFEKAKPIIKKAYDKLN